MAGKARIAVIGAGAVGRGALDAILQREDFYGDATCVAMVTRRPEEVAFQFTQEGIAVPVMDYAGIREMAGEVDVAILADASQRLLKQAPSWLIDFCTTDSCDFHGNFAPYVDERGDSQQGYVRDMADAAAEHDRVAAIGFGWDPGSVFSYHKLRGGSVFPGSVTNVFYGPGKSQGHTTALKTPDMKALGVVDAIQFTMPNEDTIKRALGGELKEFSAGERMWRDCYLLVEEGADRDVITEAIRSMPGYYAEYPKVEIEFVQEPRLRKLQESVSHQGTVITTGKTRNGKGIVEQFTCKYEDNAAATGSLLVDAAIGTARAYATGQRGIIVPGADIRNVSSPLSKLEIIEKGF